ncbi:hypothetical protein ABZX30_28790 [Streptomyces sp. NPDC004542]|uniref:hypothetical protein n=1 Tax=Streptomyces sp. NPDC004542 TaxID=3154281 RepID=UPI0033BC5FA1
MTREQIITAYNAKLDRIQASRSYSDHAKRVLAAKAYKEAQQAVEQLAAAETQQIRDRRAGLQRHMFGHADSSDPNTLLARRGATDRANELDDPRTAQTALQNALEQGDGILAQAIAKRANEWGWSDVLNAYADARPHFRRSVEEFNALPDPDSREYQLAHSFGSMVPTPPGMATASPWELDRLAQTALDGEEPARPAFGSGYSPRLADADAQAAAATFGGEVA